MGNNCYIPEAILYLCTVDMCRVAVWYFFVIEQIIFLVYLVLSFMQIAITTILYIHSTIQASQVVYCLFLIQLYHFFHVSSFVGKHWHISLDWNEVC